VVLEGRPVEAAAARVRPGVAGRSILDVTLAEGRKHVVRRWAEALGLKVERLARLSYGPIRLGELPVGKWRALTPAEERAVYRAIHLVPSKD
jgi:23S rRNA pseudouridine2605 synthase